MPYMRKQAPAQVPFLTQYMKRLKTRGMGQDSSGTDTIVDPTTGDIYDLGGNLIGNTSDYGTRAFSPKCHVHDQLSGVNVESIEWWVQSDEPFQLAHDGGGCRTKDLPRDTATGPGSRHAGHLQSGNGPVLQPDHGPSSQRSRHPEYTSTLFPAGLSSSSLSSILLIGGIGLAAVLVIGMVNK